MAVAYSPWANGKVPGNSVREILDEYKNFWLHSSLRKLVRPAKDTIPPPRGTPVSDGQGRMALTIRFNSKPSLLRAYVCPARYGSERFRRFQYTLKRSRAGAILSVRSD
jgi:hypothetical protein